MRGRVAAAYAALCLARRPAHGQQGDRPRCVQGKVETGPRHFDIDGGTGPFETRDERHDSPTGEPFRLTLAWTDYPSNPAASVNLVNDLNLEVESPSGDQLVMLFEKRRD